MKRTRNYVNVRMPVTVRKHTVDIPKLQQTLRQAKKEKGLSCRQLANQLIRPLTEVEHWFRTDACFSIPHADVWPELKECLTITTDEWDAPITEFIIQDGVYDKANRCYLTDGLAPTLTVASADEKIIIPPNLTATFQPLTYATPTNRPFTYVSLFAGIGGFEQALRHLHAEGKLAAEIDTATRFAFQQLYDVPTAKDVCLLDDLEIPAHDLLVAGFPCQSFSIAGKRLGLTDTRGTLFHEVTRIAKAKKPKVVVLENVKGLFSHEKGKTLHVILQHLNDSGYLVAVDVLNTAHFGLPQNRERTFIVAVRSDLVKEGTPIPSNQLLVRRFVAQHVDTVQWFSHAFPKGQKDQPTLASILEPTVHPSLQLEDWVVERIVPQIKEQEVDVQTVRRLSVRECFRLQGFSETDIDVLEGLPLSDYKKYQMAGNAVSVPVVHAVIQSIIPYLTS